MRTSGVGFLETMLFAIAQIFCFAPSISPPMDPVESRTNATSTRGRAAGAVTDCAPSPAAAAAMSAAAANPVTILVLMMSPPNLDQRVVDDDIHRVSEGEPLRRPGMFP